MATRIIRDGILTSERINALSPNAELFYRRLMSVADDHGRYSANLTQLRAYCYPLKLDSVKEDSISKHLAECVDARLIVLYTVDGKPYLQMVDFGQRINGKSKFPEPSPEISGDSPGFPGVSRLGEDVDEDVDEGGKGARTKGKSKDRTLPDWIDGLGGADAIPADDPLFDWAKSVGLPREWIALAWWGFEARYADGPKKYTDWRAVFRRAVREDWLKLWRVDRDGSYSLTTAGEQLRREMAS